MSPNLRIPILMPRRPAGGEARPLVDFEADDFTPFVDQEVNFTFTNSRGPASTYVVDYGDGFGESGSGEAPDSVHQYVDEGIFTARYTATNGAGSWTASRVITVTLPE